MHFIWKVYEMLILLHTSPRPLEKTGFMGSKITQNLLDSRLRRALAQLLGVCGVETTVDGTLLDRLDQHIVGRQCQTATAKIEKLMANHCPNGKLHFLLTIARLLGHAGFHTAVHFLANAQELLGRSAQSHFVDHLVDFSHCRNFQSFRVTLWHLAAGRICATGKGGIFFG